MKKIELFLLEFNQFGHLEMQIITHILLLLIIGSFSCKRTESHIVIPKKIDKIDSDSLSIKYQKLDTIFNQHPEYIADSFDFPVGKPDTKGYYNAQKFLENNHLGDDWNGIGGGNSDLGDPIYVIGNGYITFAEEIGGGWGKVIRIIHRYNGSYYESIYAHCDTIQVQPETLIKKGTQIATIGNANGQYWAHLHLELRDDIFMDIGGGYAEDTSGYLDPTVFIQNN